MKKTILFLFFAGLLSAQETAVSASGKTVMLNNDKTWSTIEPPAIISPSEFTYNEKNASVVRKTINLKNGVNELVPVEFDAFVFKDFVNNIKFDKVEHMMEVARVAAKYSLKNKNTFRPISASLSATDASGVMISIKYLGENDYGAKKDAFSVTQFDTNGNEIKK